MSYFVTYSAPSPRTGALQHWYHGLLSWEARRALLDWLEANGIAYKTGLDNNHR